MSAPESMCRQWFVSGRVQGVGFRWFVSRAAASLGLVGTVRNLPDGRVEVVARGSEETLRLLEEKLKKGPTLARVQQVEAHEATLPDDLRQFLVTG